MSRFALQWILPDQHIGLLGTVLRQEHGRREGIRLRSVRFQIEARVSELATCRAADTTFIWPI